MTTLNSVFIFRGQIIRRVNDPIDRMPLGGEILAPQHVVPGMPAGTATLKIVRYVVDHRAGERIYHVELP